MAALATVIPVIPNTDLKTANRFQRPSIIFGLLAALIVTTLVNL